MCCVFDEIKDDLKNYYEIDVEVDLNVEFFGVYWYIGVGGIV